MQYFTIQELSASATAERLAIDNTPPRAARKMLTILVEQLLDPIRRRYGAPIIVTSGYRCPALNTAVGGVANSHHIVGCAADIVAPLCSQAKLLDADKSTAVATDARTASAPQGGKTPTSMTELLPLGGGWEGATELTDQHVNSLYCRFCLDTGRQAKIGDFYIIIESDFYPEYHPLKEYLESLPAWDGVTDYIDQLASTVHVTGCTQEMHNRFFKKWMVAMVAAWLDDSTTNHEILTYIGEQGKYKTSFMTHLLPPALDKYFAIKHFNHSMSKDDRLALTELALIDLEELDNLRPEAVNLLKAVTTDPAINLRPVWERYALRRQHIASFCGTGNNPRFLTDLSGNRRWLAFMVDSIDSPWERTTDYDGIYAQAYALWKQGFRYWFDDEENAELERHNRQFEEPNIEEELILTYLRQP